MGFPVEAKRKKQAPSLPSGAPAAAGDPSHSLQGTDALPSPSHLTAQKECKGWKWSTGDPAPQLETQTRPCVTGGEHRGADSWPQIPDLLLFPKVMILISPWIKLSGDLLSEDKDAGKTIPRAPRQPSPPTYWLPHQDRTRGPTDPFTTASSTCYAVLSRGHWSNRGPPNHV